MGMMVVQIWDAMGKRRQLIELPDDEPVNRILAELTEKMNLPSRHPDGRMLAYKFHHSKAGQLRDTQSLQAAGIKESDVLRLYHDTSANMKESIFAPASVGIEEEGRFDRLQRLEWWDREKLTRAKVLVLGAGALGNEILKNLALLGVGRIFVADLDTIEHSNLSRSVLFRERHEGKPKAEIAAVAVREISSDARVAALSGDIIHELGLGVYRWADVVVAALDNREARLHVNRCCFLVNKPCVDAATEAFKGIVRVFVPPKGPCYECTMSEADWQAFKERRGCAGLRNDALPTGRVPTMPTTSSILAAIQCQEVLKLIHGLPGLAGKGLVYDGLTNDSHVFAYSVADHCESHHTFNEVVALKASARKMTLLQGLQAARYLLGTEAVLELRHELLVRFECPTCGGTRPVYRPLASIPRSEAMCRRCGVVRRPVTARSLNGSEDFLGRTFADCGVPPLDIVTARRGMVTIGLEFSEDHPKVLGSLGD